MDSPFCREKLDALSRRFFDSANGGMSFISDVALLLVDEVHMLSEDRGPTLEAGVVCRLRTLGSMRELARTNLSSMRILAASATIPNIHDIARWLTVQKDGCKVTAASQRNMQMSTILHSCADLSVGRHVDFWRRDEACEHQNGCQRFPRSQERLPVSLYSLSPACVR